MIYIKTDSLNHIKENLDKVASSYHYDINYFYKDFNQNRDIDIQRCEVNHTQKLIRIPRNPSLEDLYGYCHELGHIINISKENLNNETNAWDVAYELCLKFEIPLDKFDEIKEKCLATYKKYGRC